jgi:hypothetical protein
MFLPAGDGDVCAAAVTAGLLVGAGLAAVVAAKPGLDPAVAAVGGAEGELGAAGATVGAAGAAVGAVRVGGAPGWPPQAAVRSSAPSATVSRAAAAPRPRRVDRRSG